MAKKRRRSPRLLLSWSMRDQKRFIEAVERFQALVNDLEKLLLPELRRLSVTRPPAELPAAPIAASSAGGSGVRQAGTISLRSRER